MGSSESNRCAVSVGPKRFEIQDQPLATEPLGSIKVLIKVIATGICGSDAHSWGVGTPKPLTLCHKSVGIVIEVGSGVKDRKMGIGSPLIPVSHAISQYEESVQMNQKLTTRRCDFCKRGSPNTCTSFTHSSTPPTTEGSLCQFFRCKFARAVLIADKVSWEVAGCIRPLAVTVQLCRKAKLKPHQTVAVL